MNYIKQNYKFILIVIFIGLIGGIFSSIYAINTLDSNILEEGIKQLGSKNNIIIITTVQVLIYAIAFTILGIVLSNKIGLWKKISVRKRPLITSLLVGVIGGIILIYGDLLFFGKFNEIIKHSYDAKPSIEYIISSFTYGAVIEEVMMRLFFMSLISFIIFKIFYSKEKNIPTSVFIIANIISALAFAAGHLPMTIQVFGGLNFLLVARCLIMNGIFGLAFGWLYRKNGIIYAFIAHFIVHFISKLIWLLFI